MIDISIQDERGTLQLRFDDAVEMEYVLHRMELGKWLSDIQVNIVEDYEVKNSKTEVGRTEKEA